MYPIDYISDQSQAIPPGQDGTIVYESLIGDEQIRRFLIDSAHYLGLPMDQVDWLNLQTLQEQTQ